MARQQWLLRKGNIMVNLVLERKVIGNKEKLRKKNLLKVIFLNSVVRENELKLESKISFSVSLTC